MASQTPRACQSTTIHRDGPLAAAGVMGGTDEDNNDQDVWRPDGRGGVAWRKITSMSCMERYESLYNFIEHEIQ